MKKVLAVLVSVMLFGSFALAQAADEQKAAQPPKGMPMMDHQMMMKCDKGMMDCPMMKDGDGKSMMIGSMVKGGMMKHHQMMMHDMMRMMHDMMAIQKKMLAAPTADDKATMEKELSVMMEKMDKMMTSSQCMMNTQDPAADEQKKEESAPMEHKH